MVMMGMDNFVENSSMSILIIKKASKTLNDPFYPQIKANRPNPSRGFQGINWLAETVFATFEFEIHKFLNKPP
jgi:hypothetical protein